MSLCSSIPYSSAGLARHLFHFRASLSLPHRQGLLHTAEVLKVSAELHAWNGIKSLHKLTFIKVILRASLTFGAKVSSLGPFFSESIPTGEVGCRIVAPSLRSTFATDGIVRTLRWPLNEILLLVEAVLVLGEAMVLLEQEVVGDIEHCLRARRCCSEKLRSLELQNKSKHARIFAFLLKK